MTSDGYALVANDPTYPSLTNGVTIVGVTYFDMTSANMIVGAPVAPTVMCLSNTTGSGFHGKMSGQIAIPPKQIVRIENNRVNLTLIKNLVDRGFLTVAYGPFPR